MRSPRYLKYKESGAEWLRQVPEHWKVKRLGYYFNERRERVSDKDFAALSVTKNGIVPQLETAAKSDDGDNRKKVCKGDFVINSRSDRKGSSGASHLDGSVSLICTVLYPQEQVHTAFVHHLLRCQPFQEEFYRNGKGIVADLWSTNYSEMRNILIGVPPILEQATIAAFLDRETTKIDALVAEQQRLIELLKEKRLAIVSQAVTKGMNANVPMKLSEIEWLGEIPHHWKRTRIRALYRQRKRQNHPEKPVLSVYRDYGVILKGSREDNINKTPEDLSAYQLVNPSDLVVNKMKAWQGSLGVSDLEGITSPDYIVFTPHHRELSAFIHLLLRSQRMVTVYGSISNGIRPDQWRLETDLFLGLSVFLPPSQEQRDLVSFVNAQISHFDTLTAAAQRAIDLLQERRTALISAAVTGQIDVRQGGAEKP